MLTMQADSTKRALIIKIGAIGDAIMALPLSRELVSQGYHVTWLGGIDIAAVLSLAPEISRRIIINERALFGPSRLSAALEVFRTWAKICVTSGDEIFLLHSDRRYRYLIPPWRRSHIRTVRIGSRRHHTFDYARLAYPALQDNELSFEPYTLPNLVTREKRICIFPGGAKNAMRDNPLRRWPLESYVRLCEHLISSGHKITVVGGPSDTWIEPAFAHLRALVNWQVATMKLNETVEYLRRSQLAVSHDTGPIHLASLADCPIITIFGPTNSEWFAPLKFKPLVIERSPKLHCQPCYDGKDFGFCTNNICINQITPETVAQRVLAAL